MRPTDDLHQPITAAVSFEDTHNRHGGVVWPLDDLRAAAAAARELGLRVHLDGARIFNAAVAQGVDVADIAACGDTVTFCLSKGLACPAGRWPTGGVNAATISDLRSCAPIPAQCPTSGALRPADRKRGALS